MYTFVCISSFDGEEGMAGSRVGRERWSWWWPTGSSAKKGRSLAVDHPYACRAFPGVRHDMTHAGGRSQAEERLGEAAAILTISRRRKAMYGGLF
jgi:predicted amidohydrolase YtcJ